MVIMALYRNLYNVMNAYGVHYIDNNIYDIVSFFNIVDIVGERARYRKSLKG